MNKNQGFLIASAEYWKIPLLWIFCLTCSCSGVQKAKQLESYIVEGTQEIVLGNRTNSIQIFYSGCGGFLFKDQESALLLDPYFSNLSPLLLLPFKKLKSDTTLIDSFFKRVLSNTRDETGVIKGILIGHSHYDHLADIPAIYNRNLQKGSTPIIGSETTHHILAAAGIEETRQILNPYNSQVSNSEKDSYDRFLIADGQIRITPILSEHAPHFAGVKILSSKKIDKEVKRFPRKVSQLPEGDNYNFLIDFLDENGEIKFRIFSNAGSACTAGVGFPESEILAEKEVDVLLLCVANYNQVKGYPEALIEEIQPRHIILNHWENFFRPIEKLQRRPATVPATNVRKLIQELEAWENPNLNFTLPQPGTELIFYY